MVYKSVVAHFPSMCKALSLTLSTTKYIKLNNNNNSFL